MAKTYVTITTVLQIETPHAEQGAERAVEVANRVYLRAELDKWDAGAKAREVITCRRVRTNITGPVALACALRKSLFDILLTRYGYGMPKDWVVPEDWNREVLVISGQHDWDESPASRLVSPQDLAVELAQRATELAGGRHWVITTNPSVEVMENAPLDDGGVTPLRLAAFMSIAFGPA